MVFSKDNLTGIILALLSSVFIGTSFIIKKKGLRRAAVVSGVRAGVGGYSYLIEPLWWIGMVTMIVGEVANFVAYAFAPAVLVTPLGALSIIVSAVLAQIFLKEKLHPLGILGCVMCIAGSVVIVIHAPQEHAISSVKEIWYMATQKAFLLYVGSVLVLVFILVFYFAPLCGHSNVLVFTGICSLMGSLSVNLKLDSLALWSIILDAQFLRNLFVLVMLIAKISVIVFIALGFIASLFCLNMQVMSVKALGTSIKLTVEGKNQLMYPETWFFMFVVAVCVVTQMNYLNKALDTFNTAVVSPIYYVMFTTLTIVASVIMFKDWDGQNVGSIVSGICGFIVVLSGTILLHVTKDVERSSSFRGNYTPLSPTLSTRLCNSNGESPQHEQEEGESFSDEASSRRQDLQV